MKPYAYGDQLTGEEATAIIRLFIRKPEKRRRAMRQPDKVIATLHSTFPNRLEHEVNRLRGSAFDSGEQGFSHSEVSPA